MGMDELKMAWQPSGDVANSPVKRSSMPPLDFDDFDHKHEFIKYGRFGEVICDICGMTDLPDGDGDED